MVAAHGRHRRSGAAVADHRSMPQRRLRLVGGEVPSMRDQGQHPAGRDQAATQHTDLEAGGLSEMPIMPQGQVRAARSHDPADRDAGDHAVRLGPPG